MSGQYGSLGTPAELTIDRIVKNFKISDFSGILGKLREID